MLMIDMVYSQIDTKMAALGKCSLIGQSKHTTIAEVYADILLTLNTQVSLSSSHFRASCLYSLLLLSYTVSSFALCELTDQ